MTDPDFYLNAIKHSRSPDRAALLIRARAATLAAGLYCYSDAQRVAIVVEAERLAETITRPYDGPGPKPWRAWLREAGY